MEATSLSGLMADDALAVADFAGIQAMTPLDLGEFLYTRAARAATQMFQVGNTPLLNALLYTNSPRLLAADQFFLALARSRDFLEDDFTMLIWDSSLPPNWQPAAQQGDFSVMNHQPAAGEQFAADGSAAADKIFAQMADEADAWLE